MNGKFPGRDSELQPAVVTDKKCEMHSGNQGGYLPLRYAEDCSTDDAMLSPLLNSPTGFMQQIFPGGMDPGTPGVMMRESGSLGGIWLGQFNSIKKGSPEGGSGGGGLGSLETISQLSGMTRNINIAPDIKEVGGIRQIFEKGQQHSLDLLDGLPIHGALFDIAGFRLPDIKKVNTAKQKNTGMISMDQLQQMMGQIMSLGQMIQGLAGNKGGGGGAGGFGAGSGIGLGGNSVSYMPPGANTGAGGMNYGGGLGNNIISAANAPEGTLLYDIMDGLTPDMKAAVNSLSILLQGYEVQDGVSFLTGDVVHEDTYLQNAYTLLKDVSNLDDLMYVLNRLQWDQSLRGTEKLSNVVNEIQTAWGVALQEIDVNGNIVITYGAEDANLEMEFANSMTSNTGSPALGFLDPNLDLTYSVNATNYKFDNNTGGTGGAGNMGAGGNQGGGGTNPSQVIGQVQGLLSQVQGLAQGMSQNMFGESAGTMKEMWQRMTREQENDAKQMHKKLNQESDTQKMAKIAEKLVKGGDPFEVGLFDENMLESTGSEAVGSGNFSVGFM